MNHLSVSLHSKLVCLVALKQATCFCMKEVLLMLEKYQFPPYKEKSLCVTLGRGSRDQQALCCHSPPFYPHGLILAQTLTISVWILIPSSQTRLSDFIPFSCPSIATVSCSLTTTSSPVPFPFCLGSWGLDNLFNQNPHYFPKIPSTPPC